VFGIDHEIRALSVQMRLRIIRALSVVFLKLPERAMRMTN
jgi:hypothetical protein